MSEKPKEEFPFGEVVVIVNEIFPTALYSMTDEKTHLRVVIHFSNTLLDSKQYMVNLGRYFFSQPARAWKAALRERMWGKRKAIDQEISKKMGINLNGFGRHPTGDEQ